MRRATKAFLLSGCALVLWIELPATLSALAAGWRGPYAAPDARTAQDGAPAGELVARR